MKKVRMIGLVLSACLMLTGCPASEDDPVGQAKELSDPARRYQAIANLKKIYEKESFAAKSDRSAPNLKKVIDAAAGPLAKVYQDNPDDLQAGMKVLELLAEMRDPSAIPAFIEALKWRSDVTEEHAVLAAKAIEDFELEPTKKKEAVTAIAAALDRVSKARPIDNRMREAFIHALGKLGGADAAAALGKVVSTQTDAQNFLFNYAAAKALAPIATEAELPVLIHALYAYDVKNPRNRMNDAAEAGLIRIGKPAFQPLVDIVEGKNAEITALAKSYYDLVKSKSPQVAAKMDPEHLIVTEAVKVLGSLGDTRAMPILLKEAQANYVPRKIEALVAMTQISKNAEENNAYRGAVTSTFASIDDTMHKVGVISAVRASYDSAFFPILESVYNDTKAHPSLRLTALDAYALLANGDDAQKASAFIESPSAAKFAADFKRATGTELSVAATCKSDMACYIKELGASDAKRVRKAAYMVARLGRGKPAAIAALENVLDHSDILARNAILQAFDFTADKGSASAVKKLLEAVDKEEGTSLGNQSAAMMRTLAARLSARS